MEGGHASDSGGAGHHAVLIGLKSDDDRVAIDVAGNGCDGQDGAFDHNLSVLHGADLVVDADHSIFFHPESLHFGGTDLNALSVVYGSGLAELGEDGESEKGDGRVEEGEHHVSFQ